MIHINQYLVSSSEKSNAKDELGIIYILCNLSCDIYFHNKNGFHVLIVSLLLLFQFIRLSVLSHSIISFIPLSVCPNISVLKEFVISQNVDSGQIQ